MMSCVLWASRCLVRQRQVESIFNEMDCASPVIYLLSAGADPTEAIEALARKKRREVACVSMGEVSHDLADSREKKY